MAAFSATRTTHSGVLGVYAACDDCGFEQSSRNALGLAAQHADRSGHEVHVEQTIGITYNRKT